MTDKERFGGKCPYNGSPCETFHCSKCVIEEQERRAMEELDEEESVDSSQIHYEKDERIAEMYELYKLFCGMSESMQKAVKDIMIVANGGEIDD